MSLTLIDLMPIDLGVNSNQKEFLSYLGIASSVASEVVIVGHAIFGKYVSVHTKAIYSQVIFTTFDYIYP